MEINRFKGKYDFLSNFFSCLVEYDGELYPSVEHAFQAAKTFDQEERMYISLTETAKEARSVGRKMKGIREDWDEVRLGIMEELVRYKFSQYSNLKDKLLSTGDAQLIEGNTWKDTYWGVCKGVGENHLGLILMKVREELRQGERDRVGGGD